MKVKYISTLLFVFVFVLATLFFHNGCDKYSTMPENRSPLLDISWPTGGITVECGDIVEIRVTANDGDGRVDHVEFYIDDEIRHTDTTNPYEFDWDTSEESIGEHTIRAEAVDDEGAVGQSDIISITLTEPVTDWVQDLQTVLDEKLEFFGVMGASVAIMLSDRTIIKLTSGISEENVPITEDMIFGMASITKTYTAALILLLEEEGMLSLDDSLHHYLPEYQHIDSTITIKQLLNHTTGVYNFTDHPAHWQAYDEENLDKRWTPEEVLQTMVDEPIFAPGTAYSYSNTNYILLGLIIEAVTGSTVSAEFRNRLLDPFGIENTFLLAEEDIDGYLVNSYSQFDPSGCRRYQQAFADMVWTCGGLYGTAEDISRFAIELFQGNILRAETLEEMCDLGTSGYGYGVHQTGDIAELTFALGHDGGGLGFVSRCSYIPEIDAVFVLMTNEITNDNSQGNYLTIITHDMVEVLLENAP